MIAPATVSDGRFIVQWRRGRPVDEIVVPPQSDKMDELLRIP